MGAMGHRIRHHRLRGCRLGPLGRGVRLVLRRCGCVGAVFHLQHLYRIGIQRVLRFGGRQSGATDSCQMRQKT